jgi:aminoglycoside phosphotransferase (APT) family kinase protein
VSRSATDLADAAVPDPLRLGVDVGRLAEWMDGQGLTGGAIADLRPLTGGTQNIVLALSRGGRPFVLRRPPLHLREHSNQTIRREARLLRALAGTDVPHPTLIATCEDTGVIGACFYLMEWIEGFNPTVGLPPLHAQNSNVRHGMGLELVDAALALGAVEYRAAGLEDFGKVDNYLERQVTRWQAQLKDYQRYQGWPGADELPGIAAIAGWLEQHRPASFTPGIMHGDFHISNALVSFNGPEAALVDWELATIGDPLIDLGWLLATWPQADGTGGVFELRPRQGFATHEELTARYAAASRRDVSQISWYVVFACFKLGILLEGTFARACAHQAPMERGKQLHALALGLFCQALRRIG